MQQAVRDLYNQHKFFLNQALDQASDHNRDFRLTHDSSSVAFLFQHIAESKLLLLEGLFGKNHGIPLTAVMGAHDEGQAVSLDSIRELNAKADAMIEDLMDSFDDTQLDIMRDTMFGPMTGSQLFGAVMYHSYYHLGQANLAMKRGKIIHHAHVPAEAVTAA